MGLASALPQWVRDSPDRLLARSPYFILLSVCSALFLDITNLSAITIALPRIQDDLQVSTGNLQWVLSGYALTFGAFLMVGGRAGDLYSHRTVMLMGMTVFAVFTVVCAVAPNFPGLIVARAIQGIGAALTVPSAQAHIPLYFADPKARAKALAIWGATAAVGFVIGLVIGGALTTALTWRWIFWMSLIYSCVLIVFAFVTLPRRSARSTSHEQVPEDSSEKDRASVYRRILRALVAFDAVGVCLSVPAVTLMTYALSSANETGWHTPQILVTLILSVVLIILFILHEKRVEHSLVPTHLFRDINFNLVLLVAVDLYAIRQGVTYFLTLQLQSIGNSPLETSILYLPMGIASVLFNLFLARLLPYFGARFMLTAGWTLIIIGSIFFSFTSPTRSFWSSTFIAEIISPGGIGSIILTSNFVVIQMTPREHQGAAAGILNTALQVGGSIVGLSALTAVAQGIGNDYGHSTQGSLPQVAYDSVYYSGAVMSFVGLIVSAFILRYPESLRGKLFTASVKEQTTARSSNPGVDPDIELAWSTEEDMNVEGGPVR